MKNPSVFAPIPDRQGVIFAGGEGKRMAEKSGLSKHMQPLFVGTQRKPVLAYVIEKILPWVEEVVVGVRYRAHGTERYLKGSPNVQQILRLPALDNLALNVRYSLQHLNGRILCFFYGDTIISNNSLSVFFHALDNQEITPDCPLLLLLETKPPCAQRTTIQINGDGRVLNVVPSHPEDPYRYSALAAIVLRTEIITLFPSLDESLLQNKKGAIYTLWPAIIDELMQKGLSARAVIAPSLSVNINRREDLRLAEVFLADESGLSDRNAVKAKGKL